MSITYEEALSTLTAMFTAPWDEDSLDSVLRHFEGHMENTVDAVLAHGDSPPSELVKRLEASKTGASLSEMDEQLARQLAQQEQNRAAAASRRSPQQQAGVNNSNSSSPQNRGVNRPTRFPGMAPGTRLFGQRSPQQTPSTTNHTSQSSANNAAPATMTKGRGTPTQLPPDFLRIPGSQPVSSVSGSASASISDDEALARMLQDKFFAEEVRNNPEFAHLARGGSAGGGARRPQGMGFGGAGTNHAENGEKVLKALQGMGEQAKRRFQDFASKVKQKIDHQQNNGNSSSPFGGGGGGVAERRGLLDIHDDDDDEQEISFVGGGNNAGTHEMRSMDTGFAYGGKKND